MFNLPRYIPEGGIPIERAGLPVIVYAYVNKSGLPAAIAYLGKSNKPVWHYRFMSEEMRTHKIDELFANVAYSEDQKLARKTARAAFKHGFKVGDILYSSWGYDQTNVEFYQIISTTPKTVTFREIEADYTQTGFMSGQTLPRPNQFCGNKVYTRKVDGETKDEKGAVNFAEHKGSYMKRLWEHKGQAHYTSSYA